MDYEEIIKQLIELEEYFEEGRKKTNNLRAEIQRINSAGDAIPEEESEEAKLAKLLSKKANGTSSDKK